MYKKDVLNRPAYVNVNENFGKIITRFFYKFGLSYRHVMQQTDIAASLINPISLPRGLWGGGKLVKKCILGTLLPTYT